MENVIDLDLLGSIGRGIQDDFIVYFTLPLNAPPNTDTLHVSGKHQSYSSHSSCYLSQFVLCAALFRF